MPRKKSGFPYEVHPTPMKGKDGRNIVYARPARGYKLDIARSYPSWDCGGRSPMPTRWRTAT